MPREEDIPLLSLLPFIILLLIIATMPLVFPKFWERNRNKGLITALISIPICVYLIMHFPSELIHNVKDYISFIILLSSLFIISGGIFMRGDLLATPRTNTMFLVFGSIIANFIGTTGASMLLIRALLNINSERKFTSHIPVFFIFTVSNIGGCLTPIGDPPLFLGYLRGVPFAWTLRLLPEWALTMVLVLTVFYIWDSRAYSRELPEDLKRDKSSYAPLCLDGKLNLLFLLGVVCAVAFQLKTPYMEIVMILMTALSLTFTSKKIRHKNRFTVNPITEVAILFAGIFVTMVPILMMLHSKGAQIGITKPWQFFWATGGLSSFLDNAPTYLTFFSLAQSVTAGAATSIARTVAGVNFDLLRAISIGAVFMGANTYIGNGPNFMVKSIAEEQKLKVPHFFGYMAYSGTVLIPIFILVTLIFFRG
jgi:Na+/H+ antiporter NhaD/arsenite permease-like protein